MSGPEGGGPPAGASGRRGRGRPGRPTVEEQLGDPGLADKARCLRDQDLSWSQIADRLRVGRSTARRLCQNSSAATRCEVEGKEGLGHVRPEPPFQNGPEIVSELGHHTSTDATGLPAEGPPSESATGLSESLRIFAELLRKADREGPRTE